MMPIKFYSNNNLFYSAIDPWAAVLFFLPRQIYIRIDSMNETNPT
jgi:hypothetical protein